MEKQELFQKAVKTMDNYTKAVEMGLSDFANYFDYQMRDFLAEIKHKGLHEEFEEYALIL